jgi:hypothetical protein
MPLDTTPLSTKRRLIAFCVLLAFFGGSIGLAQLIVINHTTGKHWSHETNPGEVVYPMKYFVYKPEGFVAGPRSAQGVETTWKRTGPDARTISRIDFPLFQSPQRSREENEQFVRDQIQVQLQEMFELNTRLAGPIVFGGYKARLFIGTDTAGKTRAFVAVVGARDHYMALFYSGDIEQSASLPLMTEADEAIFVEICRKSQVVVNAAAQLPPRTNPRTVPNSGPQSAPDTTPRP